MESIKKMFKSTFFVGPVFSTPVGRYLDPDDLSKFEIENFQCNCQKPSKMKKLSSTESEGIHICDSELSADQKEEIFKVFFHKYFINNLVCSDEFFVEMEKLTGRRLFITDDNKLVMKANPLSFLFYFTTTKCYSEVNWLQIMELKNENSEDHFSDDILEKHLICGNNCFLDDHLLWEEKGREPVSTLIRQKENTHMITRLLCNLQAYKKEITLKQSGFPNPEFHGKKLNEWIKYVEDMNVRLSGASYTPKLINQYNYISKLRYRNESDTKKSKRKEIVSINMCAGCGLAFSNMPVSNQSFNEKFFKKYPTSYVTPNKKMKLNDELEF